MAPQMIHRHPITRPALRHITISEDFLHHRPLTPRQLMEAHVALQRIALITRGLPRLKKKNPQGLTG